MKKGVYVRIHDRLNATCNAARRKKDKPGGHSSAGRAPALHAGGRRFDPVWLHHFFNGYLLLLLESSNEKENFSFEDLLLFNNLEISDVLSGL